MTDAEHHSNNPSSGSIAPATRQDTSAQLWLYFFGQAARVTCLWVVVYGGADWITGLHSYRVRLWTNADLAIPFVPFAALAYLSLFPMIWLAPLMLRTRTELHSFAKSLGWLIVLSGIAFILLPGEQAYTPVAPTGFGGAIYRFVDQLNLTHNYLPSLHVGMSVTCAYAYGRANSWRLAVVFWVWAAAIAVATLLTHQHYLADVFLGWILGMCVASRSR